MRFTTIATAVGFVATVSGLVGAGAVERSVAEVDTALTNNVFARDFETVDLDRRHPQQGGQQQKQGTRQKQGAQQGGQQKQGAQQDQQKQGAQQGAAKDAGAAKQDQKAGAQQGAAKDAGAAKQGQKAGAQQGAAKDQKAGAQQGAAKDAGAAKQGQKAGAQQGAAKDTGAAKQGQRGGAQQGAAKDAGAAKQGQKAGAQQGAAKDAGAAKQGQKAGNQQGGAKQGGAAKGGAAKAAAKGIDPNVSNFCDGKGQKGDGTQIRGGFCSFLPQGQVPNANKMVSSVIVSPQSGETIRIGQKFQVQTRIDNMQTGFFSDPQVQYYAIPQQLNGQGVIQGHSHITIQKLGARGQKITQPPNAQVFQFFKGLNDPAQNGILSTEVDGAAFQASGPGVYRICTMAGTFGHQPVVMPVAQRGAQDDCIRVNVE